MKFEDIEVDNYYRLVFDRYTGGTIDAFFICEEKNNNYITCKVLMSKSIGPFASDWEIGKIRKLTQQSVEKYVTKIYNDEEE